MGKSNRLDMLRVLGEPKSVEMSRNQMAADGSFEVRYVYESSGKIAGDLTVVVHELTNIVLAIELCPYDLTKEEAVKHFGSEFLMTRYAFDDCLGSEESAPLFESRSGPLLELEYRQRGIALSLTEDGKVATISYVSEPIGSRKSRCKSADEDARQRIEVWRRLKIT